MYESIIRNRGKSLSTAIKCAYNSTNPKSKPATFYGMGSVKRAHYNNIMNHKKEQGCVINNFYITLRGKTGLKKSDLNIEYIWKKFEDQEQIKKPNTTSQTYDSVFKLYFFFVKHIANISYGHKKIILFIQYTQKCRKSICNPIISHKVYCMVFKSN